MQGDILPEEVLALYIPANHRHVETLSLYILNFKLYISLNFNFLFYVVTKCPNFLLKITFCSHKQLEQQSTTGVHATTIPSSS